MKIIYKKPLLFPLLQVLFKVKWGSTIVTYNGKVYTHRKLQPEEIAHEMVHIKQQGKFPLWYIIKYIFSKKFRDASEKEAYIVQYKYLKKHEHNGNTSMRATRKIS